MARGRTISFSWGDYRLLVLRADAVMARLRKADRTQRVEFACQSLEQLLLNIKDKFSEEHEGIDIRRCFRSAKRTQADQLN